MSDFRELSRHVLHDPSDVAFRSPVGAVEAGASVRLALAVLRDASEAVRAVAVEVRGPDAGFEVDLVGEARLDGGVGYSAAFACDRPGVLLYRFRIGLVEGGAAYYVPRADGRSVCGEVVGADVEEQGWFRLTVHRAGFTTPGWMHGAIMYQVFPDRFCRGGANGDATVESGLAYRARMGRPCRLHAAWDEPPDWHDPDGPSPDGRYDPVDFFGGTLEGIASKLDYLASLGVEALYLNPIWEARSNHRYDTACYTAVDPLLGDAGDLDRLNREAERRGIRVILDAVLSHTGDDSVYFDARGTYGTTGASHGAESPFYRWYDFEHPNGDLAGYRCWWGEPTLPEVDELDPSWQDYMLGPGGVLAGWIADGASGVRLDVADELPDEVIEAIRATVKGADPAAAVIGEVWEDPTVKVSYGRRRSYALGAGLDSVMNYPLRAELVDFAVGAADAWEVAAFLTHQRLDYPLPLYHALMNLLGSHDVERIRSVLALGGSFKHLGRVGQIEAVRSIDAAADGRAARLQAMLAGFVYALPGMPCLYYGDEKGLHGGSDPFCRATMPWGDTSRPDRGADLTEAYRRLGAIRRNSEALRHGDACFCAAGADVVCAARWVDARAEAVLALMNRSGGRVEATIDLRRELARCPAWFARRGEVQPLPTATETGVSTLEVRDAIAAASLAPTSTSLWLFSWDAAT